MLALAAALLVGINLRPAITSVAALLAETTSTYALSPLAASALATLPVVAFGLTAPLGPLLARKVGTDAALAASMAVLTVALVLRVVAPEALLAGTAVSGAAIMAAGTLLPQYLKSRDASGLWVGLSSMSFGIGAALGASFTVPLFELLQRNTQLALALWAIPAALATVAMVFIGRGSRTASQPRVRPMPLDRASTVTVALATAVFGIQGLLYFAVTAYLPKILITRGVPTAEAGLLLGWFSLIGLIPTLVMPIMARKRSLLVWIAPLIGIATALGMVWLATSDGPYIVIIGMLGVVQSAAFGLALALIVQLAANSPSAGKLSAIAQGAGYALAGLGSLAIALAHDVSGSWPLALTVMAGIALVFAAVAGAAARRAPVTLLEPTSA